MFEAPRQIRSTAVGGGTFPVGLPPYSKIDIAKLLSAVWHGRTTIFCTTLAVLAAALVFIAVAPHDYTAVTQIMIDPSDLRGAGAEANQASLMSDSALLQVESQVRVLTSDAILRSVISSQRLDEDPEFVHPPSALATLFGGATVIGDPTVAALDALGRHVKVKRADRTFVVEVDVTSNSPVKAARLANLIAQTYLAEQTTVRADAARHISDSLSGQLKELQDRVRDAEEKVEAYKASHNMVGANGQLVSEQQLAEMNNQLSAARTRTAEAKSRLDQVELVQRTKDENGAFPEALQSPTISALRGQYAEIMRREAEQTTSLGELHPAVIDIQAQAARLRHMIEDEINRAAISARTEYESAKESEQKIAENFETLRKSTIGTNEAMVELRELERKAQANRSVYESVLTRAHETEQQAQVDTKNIHVISKAEPPLSRSWPPPSPLLALGAIFVGMAAGAGVVLMRPPPLEDERTGRPGDFIRKAIGIVTGDLWPLAGTPTVPVLAVLPDVDVAFGLSEIQKPASRFASEIRKIYEAVRLSHAASANASVLVLSAGAEDGSVTVALCLAATAAATQHVLLIDADLERRTLSAIDADDGEAGLVDVALGRRLLSDVIKLDRDTNINMAPLVALDSRRDRPIYDADIGRAFEQTKRYDLVVITAMNDGNPSLGFFTGLADHVVLIARASEYESAAFRQFVARINSRKIRGAVLVAAAGD